MTAPRRRLVVTVCGQERGALRLAVGRGQPRRRLDAEGIRRELRALIVRRRLEPFVSVREACAGGCHSDGPNVSVTVYPLPRPGERPSQVAIAWRTYVYSLRALDCLARIIDENLAGADVTGQPPPGTAAARRRRGR